MKNIIILLFLVSWSQSGYAQNDRCFTYDAAGNRTKRQLCAINIADDEHQRLRAVFKEEIESRSVQLENDLAELLIFPNPSSGSFQIENQIAWKNSRLQVHSVDGKGVYSCVVSDQPFDLLFLNNGIYYISVRNENIIKTAKLMITQ